jgi:spondin N
MNARALALGACLLAAGCAAPMMAPPGPGATYEITIVRSFSETTHPLDWPGFAAHLTGGIGATHDAGYQMFAAGRIATPGLELLSQKGQASPFDQELAAAQARGNVGAIFQTAAIRTVGGTSSAQVRATDAFPLLSFAMMVAPSPDWFTGVSSLALKRNGQWIDSETVTLYAWDSGTNHATTYKAEKIAANPFVPIALNDAPMFLQKGTRVPVATATIRRVGG